MIANRWKTEIQVQADVRSEHIVFTTLNYFELWCNISLRWTLMTSLVLEVLAKFNYWYQNMSFIFCSDLYFSKWYYLFIEMF